jgi:hypothetical protein
LAQLALVALAFAGGAGVLALLPLFVGIAIVTGGFTGVVVDVLLARIDRLDPAGAA